MATSEQLKQAGQADERTSLISPAALADHLASPFYLPSLSSAAGTSAAAKGLSNPPASPVSTNRSEHGLPRPKGFGTLDNNHLWGASLSIFGRAVGIDSHPVRDAELPTSEHRKSATGIYRAVINGRRLRLWQCRILNAIVYACHLVQILVGATLTAFGPVAGNHAVAITVLGSVNTVIAGILALFKGQGLQERLHKDEVGFTCLQAWIEETYAMVEAGVLGRSRQEVDMLVEAAFRKYNAVLANEENNRHGNYVRPEPEDGRSGEDRNVHWGYNTDIRGTYSKDDVSRLNLPSMRPMA